MKKKVIFVDIDETICYIEGEDVNSVRDYSKAKPIEENIVRVNELYNEGHTIIYWTARGSGLPRGTNWYETTMFQLLGWGAKFHELRLGKPIYDLLICDRTLNPLKEWK